MKDFDVNEYRTKIDLFKQEAVFWRDQFFKLAEIVSHSKREALKHIDKIKNVLGI